MSGGEGPVVWSAIRPDATGRQAGLTSGRIADQRAPAANRREKMEKSLRGQAGKRVRGASLPGGGWGGAPVFVVIFLSFQAVQQPVGAGRGVVLDEPPAVVPFGILRAARFAHQRLVFHIVDSVISFFA